LKDEFLRCVFKKQLIIRSLKSKAKSFMKLLKGDAPIIVLIKLAEELPNLKLL